MAPVFAFEECLLKHYVRTHGWLPHCKARKLLANQGVTVTQQRRLRYFTFCAIGAIDVLMLDVAKVLRPSAQGNFDTVVFFDKDLNAVLETQKRIPGAIGFPGSFTEIVLAAGSDAAAAEDADVYLRPPVDQPDELAVRKRQRAGAVRALFIKQFPFDVVNLDLEEFAFKPNDPFPGKVIGALRKILAWQRNPLFAWPRDPARSIFLSGFTLMFTTKIGPENISAEYTGMLEEYLTKNLANEPALIEVLSARTGTHDAGALRESQFEEFFRIGLPKVLTALAMEADWFVDPQGGITTYEFARPHANGQYKMLHLVMNLKRQEPKLENRAPNSGPPTAAKAAYATVVRKIFEERAVEVTDKLVAGKKLEPSLDKILARRRKYYPDE